MADNEIRKRSVTKNDVGTVGGSSVIQWMLYSATPQATGLPAYWSPSRDHYLRLLQYEEFHDFWGGAIGIAVTKMSSLAWELESDQPRVRNYFQDLLLQADDNQSWVKFISRHLQDFICCDNGAFVEVVRASSAAGSRILGLMHLDSLRCTRTGDPDIPVLYRDTQGVTHEVQAHQVLMFADMASPSETYFGVGLCAASRAWGAIKKLEAIERYIYEKISGSRALALDLVGGVLEKDIETGVQAAREMNEARGNTSYLGSVMVAVPSDVPVTHTRIDFASLPDGFVYDTQVNNAILTIANAIGLDVQDLQPLTGRPLGSGEQSQVLADKATGKGLAAWRQQWTHETNQYILPNSVVFAFSEKDLTDQQRQADVNKTNADTAATLVDKGIVTPAQAQQILADAEVIPQEFVPDDTTPREAISDTEKPQVEAAAQDGAQAEAPPETQPEETAAKEFNPDQPRDDTGKWTGRGGGGGGGHSGGTSGGDARAKISYSDWRNGKSPRDWTEVDDVRKGDVFQVNGRDGSRVMDLRIVKPDPYKRFHLAEPQKVEAFPKDLEISNFFLDRVSGGTLRLQDSDISYLRPLRHARSKELDGQEQEAQPADGSDLRAQFAAAMRRFDAAMATNESS